MRALYNGLWYAALPFALVAAGGLKAGNRRERLARFEPLWPECRAGIGDGPRIWVHAASVGEIEAVQAVVKGIGRKCPKAAIVLTTMTETGREAARQRLPDAAALMLAPLDCRPVVRAFLRRVRPDLVAIAETELWPNYMIESRRFGARVAIVNGRISQRSLKRYRWARPLFVEALSSVQLILVQTEADALRYAALGAPQSRIVVTGNTKLDPASDTELVVRPQLEQFAEGRRLLIAGSTAEGEDEVVAEAFGILRRRIPDLALVLAPRHVERAAHSARVVEAALDLSCALASRLGLDSPSELRRDVLILDTMGELRALYGVGALAFVGGTLGGSRGGQNLAEPAAASLPVMFGPSHENQRQIAQALLEAGGGFVVHDARELAQVSERLLDDELARAEAGRQARGCVEKLGGAVESSLSRLLALANLS